MYYYYVPESDPPMICLPVASVAPPPPELSTIDVKMQVPVFGSLFNANLVVSLFRLDPWPDRALPFLLYR